MIVLDSRPTSGLSADSRAASVPGAGGAGCDTARPDQRHILVSV